MGVLTVGDLKEVRVPDIGDFEHVDAIEVLVASGDAVRPGQSLVTRETDKSTMDVPADVAGVIREVRIAVGDKVSRGSLIATLESTQTSVAQQPRVSPANELRERTVPLARTQSPDLETQPARGPAAPAQASAMPASRLPSRAATPHATPSIRKLARQLSVALEQVQPSGTKQRITRDDVQRHVRAAMTGSARMPAAAASAAMPAGLLPWPQVDFAKFGPIERADLPRIRKLSGANLHRNWVMIPHVTNHEDADITGLEAFRVQLNRENEMTGVKVTLLALPIKGCVAALKKFPDFNASLDGEQIVRKRNYHIGFAADTPNGLVVPVIRNADQKGVLDLAPETAALAVKAREGKLAPADMTGGTFSVSSLGGIGGSYFTPIINAPEVAILGVGKSQMRVGWVDGQAVPRLILPLSLSWDHRVIDGAAAGRFNAYLAHLLGDFRRVLLR